jgi:hypothetical protein
MTKNNIKKGCKRRKNVEANSVQGKEKIYVLCSNIDHVILNQFINEYAYETPISPSVESNYLIKSAKANNPSLAIKSFVEILPELIDVNLLKEEWGMFLSERNIAKSSELFVITGKGEDFAIEVV